MIPAGEPVTRIRREATGGTDRYGQPLTADVEADLGSAAFDPGGTREPVEVGRAPVVTNPTLYFTHRPDVAAGDRVRVRGRVFEVDGDPADWRSPWDGVFGGLVVNLQVVTG